MKAIGSFVLCVLASSACLSSNALACFSQLTESEALARKAEAVQELLQVAGKPATELFSVEFASFPTSRGARGDCRHIQYATDVTVTWDDDSNCKEVYKVTQVWSKVFPSKLNVTFEKKTCK